MSDLRKLGKGVALVVKNVIILCTKTRNSKKVHVLITVVLYNHITKSIFTTFSKNKCSIKKPVNPSQKINILSSFVFYKIFEGPK
jgi:hypothetical protein